MPDHQAPVETRGGQQQSGDELAGGRCVDGHLAAGDPAGGRTRSAAGRRRGVGVDPTPMRAAPPISGPSGRAGLRVAVEGHPPVARPATGGRNRMTVPARPTSTWAGPVSGRGRTSQAKRVSDVEVHPHPGETGGH